MECAKTPVWSALRRPSVRPCRKWPESIPYSAATAVHGALAYRVCLWDTSGVNERRNDCCRIRIRSMEPSDGLLCGSTVGRPVYGRD